MAAVPITVFSQTIVAWRWSCAGGDEGAGSVGVSEGQAGGRDGGEGWGGGVGGCGTAARVAVELLWQMEHECWVLRCWGWELGNADWGGAERGAEWRGVVEGGEVLECDGGGFEGVGWGSGVDGVDSVNGGCSGKGLVLFDEGFVLLSIPGCEAEAAGRTVVDYVFTAEELEGGSETAHPG